MPDPVTREEFDALEARVTILEGNAPPVEPEQPPSTEGMQAKPISNLIETFGVNTFSSMDEHNVWGSWPADYRPETVIKSLQWILGNSGFHFGIREYHYAGRESFQEPWLTEINAAFKDIDVTMCVGANGSVNDVPSLINLYDKRLIDFVEGLNEPNTDFGSGQVSVATTMAIQQEIWNSIVDQHMVMGPSIVAGMPHPEGWITGYFGDQMDNVNQMMYYGNGHYYPPGCPDIIGNGTSTTDYIGGLWTAYGQHGIMLTEFHPTLYNNEGNAPGQAGWDGKRDAYYTIMTLLRCEKCNVPGLWWYALYDYGTTYTCGLFPKNENDPRPVAHVLKYLCEICQDNGDKYLQPDPLNIQVSGLDANYYGLYGNSFGEYYLFLWKADKDVGGSFSPIDITLDRERMLEEYDLIAIQKGQNARGRNMTVMLNNTVKVVKIK